jgi:hypothetical protein
MLSQAARETRDTLASLRAKAREHYTGSSETLVLVHELESLVLKARASQLLGLFQSEWHVHAYHWRIAAGAVIRGPNPSKVSTLCVLALAAAGESPNVNDSIWAIAERDPTCRAELLQLFMSRGVSRPSASTLLQNIRRLHVPPECVCTGLKILGGQVAWVSCCRPRGTSSSWLTSTMISTIIMDTDLTDYPLTIRTFKLTPFTLPLAPYAGSTRKSSERRGAATSMS